MGTSDSKLFGNRHSLNPLHGKFSSRPVSAVPEKMNDLNLASAATANQTQ